jgi:hypothetical protein
MVREHSPHIRARPAPCEGTLLPTKLYGKKPERPGACARGEWPYKRISRHKVRRAGFFLGISPAGGCQTLLAEQGLASRSPTACGGEIHILISAVLLMLSSRGLA